MSRHAAIVGRTQLPKLASVTPPSAWLLAAGWQRASTTVLLSSAGLGSTARAGSTGSGFAYNAATKDIIAPWPCGPSISLGLRQTGLVDAASPGASRTQYGSRLIAALAQRRWKSDQIRREEQKPAREAQKKEDAASSHTDENAAGGMHLLDRLPHLHRPTKDELLAAATGFWHRVGIRFKWFSIRSARPFKVDEFFAFASWILWAHIFWVVLGTTTFVSLAILAINTVFAQETLAGWVGNYLTKSSGVKVVFESAIVPKWDSGVITFNKVFVSRRPGKTRDRAVSKGSSTAAALAAAAATQVERATQEPDEEDTNYTQFDVTIDTVNVTLSFTKWFNGKGLLRDVEVRGVRGIIDRTYVHSTGEYVDPKSYRHEHNIGDFEIDGFKMSDVLLTVYQPNNFRPFTASVFSCELPRLRKQWLFYDFLSATTMSGSFDNSLFTIHPVQAHGPAGVALNSADALGDPSQWKKKSRIRIDGLKIDHLNRGVEGPFSWIHEGNVDIVADLTIPNDEDGSIAKVMSDFYDRMEATVSNVQTPFHREVPQHEEAAAISQQHILTTDPTHDHDHSTTYRHQTQIPSPTTSSENNDDDNDDDENNTRFLILDIRCHLNSIHATVPLFPPDLSYINAALVRPIVAYINSKRAFIPVHCRVVKRQSEFDGSWTIFDSGLLDDLSKEIYEAFSRDVQDAERRNKRMRKVGLWTLQVAAQALFIGLVGQVA